ncbi:MAG: PLP-dependent transferase [Solirubrobacteraceae bacterium]
MAAIDAVLRSVDRPVLAPSDGYHKIPGARFVQSDTAAYLSALKEGDLLWVETPCNPLLSVVDIAAVCEAAHSVGALVAVDNTVATPSGQTPLALGADFSVCAGTKGLSGHSDVLYGSVACATAASKEGVEGVRRHGGGILGPFEAYLAYRSLATLELRVARSSETALALAQALDVPTFHPYFSEVAPSQMRHFGPLVSFDLGTQEAAERFLSRCVLVEEATSFGGVHSTAERRARWGTDDVSPGLIRLSAGIEDTDDIVADVLAALSAS